jgi:hypothetical protein
MRMYDCVDPWDVMILYRSSHKQIQAGNVKAFIIYKFSRT